MALREKSDEKFQEPILRVLINVSTADFNPAISEIYSKEILEVSSLMAGIYC